MQRSCSGPARSSAPAVLSSLQRHSGNAAQQLTGSAVPHAVQRSIEAPAAALALQQVGVPSAQQDQPEASSDTDCSARALCNGHASKQSHAQGQPHRAGGNQHNSLLRGHAEAGASHLQAARAVIAASRPSSAEPAGADRFSGLRSNLAAAMGEAPRPAGQSTASAGAAHTFGAQALPESCLPADAGAACHSVEELLTQ